LRPGKGKGIDRRLGKFLFCCRLTIIPLREIAAAKEKRNLIHPFQRFLKEILPLERERKRVPGGLSLYLLLPPVLSSKKFDSF